MHPALKSDIYQHTRKLLMANRSFVLVDTNGESKHFDSCYSIFNLRSLQMYFKLAYELDAPFVSYQEVR